MILGCLHSTTLREHTKYLSTRMQLPLLTPTTRTKEDGLFASLRRSIPKTKAQEAWNNAWILVDTWILFNTRVSEHLDPARDQGLVWCLRHKIKLILKSGRRRRKEEAGGDIKALLASDPPSTKKHGIILRGGTSSRPTAHRHPLG